MQGTIMQDATQQFLERADQRLTTLDERLAQAASAREVAWAVCEFAGRELELADCVVYLPDGADSLLQQAAWGPKRAADQVLESRIRLAAGRGVVGDCARQQATQRVADTRNDARYVADDQVNLSELAVPLLHDGRVMGVLDSEHPDAGFYDARHEQALRAIADRAAARLVQLQA
jgi:putative methionine-R-sulfoxide reductase with GAF domain